jgi:hypothetical protein
MVAKLQPAIVELHVDRLEIILDKVEHELGAEDSEPLRKLLRAYLTLAFLLKEKDFSITRLRRLLFGPRTERTRDAADCQSESTSPSTHETAPPDE